MAEQVAVTAGPMMTAGFFAAIPLKSSTESCGLL